MSQTIDRRR